MKAFLKEFKNFAIKGNLIDMTIWIIIGTAFNNVLNTLVKKMVMPPLSLLGGDQNIRNKKYILKETSATAEEIAIGYGEMIEVTIDFIVIAFTIFVVVKFIKRFKSKSEDPENIEVETPKNIELLSNIEQLMEEQNALLKKRE